MPRRFVFRLQPVLDQRERIEERAQLLVAELERDRIRIEATLRAIQAELLETRAVLRAGLHRSAVPGESRAEESPMSGGGISAVRAAASASLHITVRAQRAAMELAGLLKRLEMARSELLRATADRKAVQLLKDRAIEQFRREQLKRELSELDEIVVMRHGRSEASLAAETAERRSAQ